MLQHLEGYQGRISRTVMDLSEITSPSHLYQRANDIDRGGRRRHGEVTCVSTLSCFGTDRGHDHLEVDDRPFSSFFSTSRIMRPISRQVPRAHDGHLSLCDASSHSGLKFLEHVHSPRKTFCLVTSAGFTQAQRVWGAASWSGGKESIYDRIPTENKPKSCPATPHSCGRSTG